MEDLRSMNKKDVDVLYSLVKESQISQKNVTQANGPNVLYSEVKMEHSLPSALGHLHGPPTLDSKTPTLDTRMPTLDTRTPTLDTRTPTLLNSLKDLSQCEVLEMKFATSIQTVNSRTISSPVVWGRGGNPDDSLLYSQVTLAPEADDTYEQLPFWGCRAESEYEVVNQISNYSVSSTHDNVSTRTSKEVTSREFNKKMAVAGIAQDGSHQTRPREVGKPAGRKPNVAKVSSRLVDFASARWKIHQRDFIENPTRGNALIGRDGGRVTTNCHPATLVDPPGAAKTWCCLGANNDILSHPKIYKRPPIIPQ